VKLQETQLRQWVDIDDWECRFGGLIEGNREYLCGFRQEKI
jgi:hypothetical protein